MEIVVTASLITAFLAGVAALFAPCCIGVLLPSYFASIFRTKTKIFLMTFIYFLGLLTVFLPLGLGIAGLSQLLKSYHSWFFVLGGIFMLALGVSLMIGRSFMIPIKVKPELKKYDFGSTYVLGIFSGIATSCCAPVLAGVLTLSALPGSWVFGPVYALTFVMGMVIPLFIMSALVDKSNIINKFKGLKRRINYTVLGYKFNVSLSHFVAGVLYIAIGGFILIYARKGPETLSSMYQLNVNLLLARITQAVSRVTDSLPEIVWVLLFIALFIFIAWVSIKQARKNPTINKEEQE